MDYSLSVWSIASYIEANIKDDITSEHLEKITGFSYRHIRTIIKENTGLSLSKYILNRKISHAAYEMVHSNKQITDIAFEYNFNSYDSFARAFKRVTEMSPKAFKEGKYKVGHRRILMGFYGPEVFIETDSTYTHPSILEDYDMNKRVSKEKDSCILYGVTKVAYSFEESTPLAMSIKSALNYLGEEIDYTNILSAMGAAFRLRWNKDYWDGGNIDVLNIYSSQYEVVNKSFASAGYDYNIFYRYSSSKDQFKDIIKSEINQGKPVIALGIIGPPEAGVICGYQDDGETLLGWNVFQEQKDMVGEVVLHDNGYYTTKTWWDNPSTFAIITIGKNKNDKTSNLEILKNGYEILTTTDIDVATETGKIRDHFHGGVKAYDAWEEAITDDSQFGHELITPLKIEKLMCQGDAQAMVGEGRYYAAVFMKRIAKEYPAVSELALKAADEFRSSSDAALKMNELRGGFLQSEETLNKFMDSEVRRKTALLVKKAKEHEIAATNYISEILKKVS